MEREPLPPEPEVPSVKQVVVPPLPDEETLRARLPASTLAILEERLHGRLNGVCRLRNTEGLETKTEQEREGSPEPGPLDAMDELD